jgi:hypothetical protein
LLDSIGFRAVTSQAGRSSGSSRSSLVYARFFGSRLEGCQRTVSSMDLQPLTMILEELSEPRFKTLENLRCRDLEWRWSAEFLELACDGSSVYVFDDPLRVAVQSWSEAVDRSLEVSASRAKMPSTMLSRWRWLSTWDGLTVAYTVGLWSWLTIAGLIALMNAWNAVAFIVGSRQWVSSDWVMLFGWSDWSWWSVVTKLTVMMLVLTLAEMSNRQRLRASFMRWREDRAQGWVPLEIMP